MVDNRYRYLLLLGGNLGDVEALFGRCREMMAEEMAVVDASGIYYSKAWGFEAEEIFRNQVVEVESSWAPMEMLDLTQEMERRLGRDKKSQDGKYESRKIDIDILMARERDGLEWKYVEVKEARLTIPHALMHKRMFTMKPLAEKWGEWLHTTLGKRVEELYEECGDEGEVWTR